MWVTIITKLELGVVLAATVNCEHMKYDENFHTKIKVERLKGFYDNKDLLHFGLEIRHIGKPLNSFYWTGNIFLLATIMANNTVQDKMQHGKLPVLNVNAKFKISLSNCF